MSNLADLFDDERATVGEFTPSARELPTDAGLAGLLGSPRRTAASPPVDDTRRLVDLVESAVATATPVVVSGGGKAKKSSRGHKRTDWLNVAAAVLAVGVVSATAVFAGIQFASASPADGALQSLATDEAALVNAEQALATAVTRAEADIASGVDDATRLESSLAAVTTYSDEAARAATVQAVADYRSGLEAIDLAEEPAAYARPEIDEHSLAEVGAAINEVQAQSSELATRTEQMRAVRQQIANLRDRFAAQLAAFGGTFPAWAATVTAENDQAEQSFRDAVTEAAAAVATEAAAATQAGGVIGARSMLAFPALVDALRADQQRALDEIAAAEEEEPESGGGLGDWWGGGDSGEPAPTPVDPGTPPTDPGTPPTDPGTPPVTDPPAPEPEPVPDPGTGG